MVNISGGLDLESLAKVKNLPRQIDFALATALTLTAQQAQAASLAKIGETFTIRTSWASKSNKFGIKISAAKRDDLTAQVKTLAWWLESHEIGEERQPRGNTIAVPTDQIRRTKRDLIPLSTRRKIFDKSNPNYFVLESRRGPVIATRIKSGKATKLQVLAGLEKTVTIKKQSTFYEPIQQTAEKNFASNFQAKLKQAIETARAA